MPAIVELQWLRPYILTQVPYDELGLVILNFHVSGKITKMTSLF